MINPSWTKWILSSVFQYFKDNVTANMPLYVPAQQLPPDISGNRFELIHLGPDFLETTDGDFRADLVINVVVITNKDTSNLMYHYDVLGSAYSFFRSCIPVYKYGDTVDDDQSQIGALQLLSNVKTTDISMFDPVSQQQRSTLEAKYFINL